MTGSGPHPRADAGDIREDARELFWHLHDRSRYRCPGCGRSREETASMHVHHIDGNPTNATRGNLVALCHTCHLGGEHDLDVEDPRLTKPTPTNLGPPGVSASPPSPDF